jgi:hypothetical protein
MALGSTKSVVKMSTRNIPGGKGGRCVRVTTSPPSRAECHEIWEPKPLGTLWTTPGLLWDSYILVGFIIKACQIVLETDDGKNIIEAPGSCDGISDA